VPAATTLTAWNSGGASVPLERGDERVAWCEGRGKRESGDGAVRRVRILDRHDQPVDAHRRREALVPVVGLLQMLEPNASFAFVDLAPLRARPERVQVLMDVHLA